MTPPNHGPAVRLVGGTVAAVCEIVIDDDQVIDLSTNASAALISGPRGRL